MCVLMTWPPMCGRSWSVRHHGDSPGPWLAVPLGDAAALADVIGMLAAATPRQHRELAEAIRAAAAIAGDGSAGERS